MKSSKNICLFRITEQKMGNKYQLSQDLDSAIPEMDMTKQKSLKSKPYIGFLCSFLSCLFYALSSVIVKKLWYINPGELSVARNLGILIGALPTAIYCVKDILGEKSCRGLLVVRGLVGSFSLFCLTASYKYLPLAEATAVVSAFPIVTTLISRIFLKEECGIFQSILLVLAACGVLLSVRLPKMLVNRGNVSLDYAYVGGLMAAVGCILFQSTAFVILRKIKNVHFSILMLYYGALGVLLSTCISFAFDSTGFVSPRCGWDQIFIMLVGFFSYLGSLANTIALQVERAGIVAALRSMEIVMAMIFQVLFFSDVLDAYNIGGGCLVMFSLIMMGVRKWILMLPKKSNVRKRLKFLLL